MKLNDILTIFFLISFIIAGTLSLFATTYNLTNGDYGVAIAFGIMWLGCWTLAVTTKAYSKKPMEKEDG